MRALGLDLSVSWSAILGFAVAWLAFMLACSPLADRLATRLVDEPPTLEAFRFLQQSRAKLVLGIVAAWVLGGFLEERVLRGLILRSIETFLSAWLAPSWAAAIAVCAGAALARFIHLDQGLRGHEHKEGHCSMLVVKPSSSPPCGAAMARLSGWC